MPSERGTAQREHSAAGSSASTLRDATALGFSIPRARPPPLASPDRLPAHKNSNITPTPGHDGQKRQEGQEAAHEAELAAAALAAEGLRAKAAEEAEAIAYMSGRAAREPIKAMEEDSRRERTWTRPRLLSRSRRIGWEVTSGESGIAAAGAGHTEAPGEMREDQAMVPWSSSRPRARWPCASRSGGGKMEALGNGGVAEHFDVAAQADTRDVAEARRETPAIEEFGSSRRDTVLKKEPSSRSGEGSQRRVAAYEKKPLSATSRKAEAAWDSRIQGRPGQEEAPCATGAWRPARQVRAARRTSKDGQGRAGL